MILNNNKNLNSLTLIQQVQHNILNFVLGWWLKARGNIRNLFNAHQLFKSIEPNETKGNKPIVGIRVQKENKRISIQF